jgi:hypothetical protein
VNCATPRAGPLASLSSVVSKPSVNKWKIARSFYERLTALTNLIATRSAARSVARPLRDCCALAAIILGRNRSLGVSLPALSSGVCGSALSSSVEPGVGSDGIFRNDKPKGLENS